MYFIVEFKKCLKDLAVSGKLFTFAGKKKEMKRLLCILMGVLILGFAVLENHSCTERQWHRNKRNFFVAFDLAEKKVRRNEWTVQQFDSCIVVERKKRNTIMPCVHCSLVRMFNKE